MIDLFETLAERTRPNEKKYTCKDCANIEKQIYHYCKVKPSILTNNGLHKVKPNDVSCELFEKL
jgi:hypothetical protein